MDVETWSLPICSLEGWWCCRYWAIVHSWECCSWWDMHWHMWPFGFVAAIWVQRRTALTKTDFGEEVICIYTVHIYLGTKRCYKGTFWGEYAKSVYLLQMCAEARIWKQTAFLLPPNPSNVYTLFCFFMMLKGDLILSSFQEGRGFFVALRVPSLDISYHWVIWQSVEDLDRGFTCGAGKRELLLSHPCPVEGGSMLTESCITVSSSYIWSHGLVFQRPIIPKPFLLKILLRANILTLTLRSPRKYLLWAVCMHKWAVKKAKIIFCKAQL